MSSGDSLKLLDHWQAPEDVGDAVSCLTTTFTYEADFFQKQCLGRFLQLDNQFGETDELSFVIEQEERLSQVPVTVVVDRSYAAEPRNLRWDVLPVRVPGGVQHAKVSVLIWERLMRFIVSSANLVEHSYRQNLEVAAVLDAFDDGELPRTVFMDLLGAVRRVVERGDSDLREQGPKQRALEFFATARKRLRRFDLPTEFGRGRPSVHVIDSGPRRPVLPRLRELIGGSAIEATVMSPFFDAAHDGKQPAAVELSKIGRRMGFRARFVVPVDRHAEQLLVRAPTELRDSFPERAKIEVCPIEPPAEMDRNRRLHAKAMILSSKRWTVAMAGSSNFTSAGLAVSSPANLEVNVAYRVAPSDRRSARELRRLIPHGGPIPTAEGEWEPLGDEEQLDLILPEGFGGFQLDVERREIDLALDEKGLPKSWSISVFGSELLLDASGWRRLGKPDRASVALGSGSRLPFLVEVEWTAGDGPLRLSWPLNVVDPGALPPPDELRDLPLSVLIDALSSTRPIHAALAAALRRWERNVGPEPSPPGLDPLERYAETGRFLQRARRFALALEGLTERMERPAASEESLEWRLKGPVSPLALAKALLTELEEGESMRGEAGFMLAETALTLGRVDWRRTGEIIGADAAKKQARNLIKELRRMCVGRRAQTSGGRDYDRPSDGLDRYVRRAFREARV